MKLTGNRSLIRLRNGLTIITLVTCVFSSFIPASALTGPNRQDSMPQSRFVFPRPIKKMQSASNSKVQKPADSEAQKAQIFTDQDMRKHIVNADLIVVGKVSDVRAWSRPSLHRPITEHDPQWREAVVEVETALKGTVSRGKVVILFPGTLDVAWVGVPRFKVGQQGVWVVKRERETEAYTVVDPLDFHPRNQVERVKQLMTK